MGALFGTPLGGKHRLARGLGGGGSRPARPTLGLLCLLAASPAAAQPRDRVHLTQQESDSLARQDVARRIGLFVGVDRFDDPELPTLRYAGHDAHALAAAFGALAAGPEDAVEVLTEPEETTREAVLDAVERLGTLVQRPDDTVFVGLSTHGRLIRPEDGAEAEVFLAASDTEGGAAFRTTALRLRELQERLAGLVSRRQVVLVAACHRKRVKGHVSDLLTASEASLLLYAASPGEPALESDDLQQDVYVHYFLAALDHPEADANADGAVTVTEAHEWASPKTWAHTDGLQRPRLVGAITGLDPIVLRGRPTAGSWPVARPEGPRPPLVARAKGGWTAPGHGWSLALSAGLAAPIGDTPSSHLGGGAPALGLTVGWSPPDWAGWGAALVARGRAGSQQAGPGVDLDLRTLTTTAGPTRRLLGDAGTHLAAGLGVGWRLVTRAFDDRQDDAAGGPAGTLSLTGRLAAWRGLGLVLEASGGTAALPLEGGWLVDRFVWLGGGVSWGG